MYSCDFFILVMFISFDFVFFFVLLSVLFATGPKTLCAEGFRSSETTLQATKWTYSILKRGHLGYIHHFSQTARRLDEKPELQQCYLYVEDLLFSLRAPYKQQSTAVLAWLIYHTINCLTLWRLDRFIRALNKSKRSSYLCTNTHRRL